MAVTLSSPQAVYSGPRHELTPATALRTAWISYVVLLLFPFIVFIATLWDAMYGSVPQGLRQDDATGWEWFVGCMAYIALVVPIAVFVRERIFRPYYRGQRVSPQAFLAGSLTVWIALEIAGLLSLASCFVANSIMPGLIPAAVAAIWFLPLWPSGHAMLDNHGDSDDPAHYQEPR